MFIIPIFVFASHKIFLVRLFGAPLPATPGGNCSQPPLLTYATALGLMLGLRSRFGYRLVILIILQRLLSLWIHPNYKDNKLHTTSRPMQLEAEAKDFCPRGFYSISRAILKDPITSYQTPSPIWFCSLVGQFEYLPRCQILLPLLSRRPFASSISGHYAQI